MSYVEIVNPRPIELAPRVFWLGECQEVALEDTILHNGVSIYLVAGERHSAIVEAGVTHVAVVMDQISEVLERWSLPDVKYLFLTHSELPHAGGIGHFLERFPAASAHGGVGDLHLIFPQFADRIHTCEPGDSLDLGGTELRVVDAVFRDLPYTRWAFDTRRRVLFTGDGFSFIHEHDPSQCGKLTEDVPSFDIPSMMALFTTVAFRWVGYVDIEPHIERLEQLVLDELETELIAPTHGLPIGDPAGTLPLIVDGLRRANREGTRALRPD